MAEFELHCVLREKIGSQASKALRQQGKIPATYYAHDKKSVSITLDEKEFNPLLHQEVNILNVVFPNNEANKCIVREIQKDPVTERVIHVDLLGIKLTEKVKLRIPVVLKGAPVGVKEGGILEHLLREIEVEGLPLDIPEHIEVDVSELQIGDVIKLEDVVVEKFRIVTEIHHAIANVIHPKIVQVEIEEPEEVIEGEEGAEAAPSEEDAGAKEE